MRLKRLTSRIAGLAAVLALSLLLSPAGLLTTSRAQEMPPPTAASSTPEGEPEGDQSAGSDSPQQTPRPPVYPVAVMIDNFDAARPQSGLAQADIVYEALAEGGITRFLAIYTSEVDALVGPIRSTRHYYVYWAAEYNAPLVHIMASDQGYAALVRTGLPDLDEHRGDAGFVRSPYRPAPYNAYASPADARRILADSGDLWPGSLGGFDQRTEAVGPAGQQASIVDLAYLGDLHSVRWVHDPASGHYLRSQDGAPHLDANTGVQIRAAAVVALFVPAWVLEVSGGETYLDMQLKGEGRAVFFRDGLATEGAWRRASYGNHSEYFSADGQPMAFPPGPVWVQVVPAGQIEGSLTYGGDSPAARAVAAPAPLD